MDKATSRITAALPAEAQLINGMIEDCLHRCESQLKFPRPLESLFFDHVRRSNKRQLVVATSLAIPFYCGFFAIDLLYRPELVHYMLIVRLFVVAVLSAVLVAVQINKTNDLLPSLLSVIAVTVTSLSTGIMLHSPGNSILQFEPYSFLLLAVIGNIALPLRFPFAFVATALNFLIACYFILTVPELSQNEKLAPLIYLATTTLLTLFANFRLESSQRKVFLSYLREKLYADALTRKYRSLDEISQTDHLTSIANRRQFDDFLAKSWQSACETSSSIALLMIDIDHFKRFNDTYGHVVGDECLANVASVLKDCIRDTGDLAARFGGEEFAIILPGSDRDMAAKVAERIHNRVADMKIDHETSPLGRLTVSIGIAADDRAGSGSEDCDLLVRADEALYRAKQTGRNQTATEEKTSA